MILAWLAAIFIFVPIAELTVLFKVYHAAGFMETLAIVVFTGFAGAFLVRTQGLAVLEEIRRDLAEGRMPAPRIMDGIMILAAGALLITPGLLTDTLGLLLLIPAARNSIKAWLRRILEQKLRNGTGNITFRFR